MNFFFCPVFLFSLSLTISLQERARLQAPGDADELSVIEGQLAWMVHIISAILKIRQTTGWRYVNVFSVAFW